MKKIKNINLISQFISLVEKTRNNLVGNTITFQEEELKSLQDYKNIEDLQNKINLLNQDYSISASLDYGHIGEQDFHSDGLDDVVWMVFEIESKEDYKVLLSDLDLQIDNKQIKNGYICENSLVINLDKYEISFGKNKGKTFSPNTQPYKLLLLLFESNNGVLSYEKAIEGLWDDYETNNYLDSNVRTIKRDLNKELASIGMSKLDYDHMINTAYKQGYKIGIKYKKMVG